MPDQYESVRNLPFPAVAAELGIDLSTFKKSRGEWVGACPLHGSKSNKGCFRNASDGKYHCFPCHAKGRGSIDLTMANAKTGFQVAVEKL